MAAAAVVGAWECARMLRETGALPLYALNLPAAGTISALPFWIARPQAAWIGVMILCLVVAGCVYMTPAIYSAARPGWISSFFPALYVGIFLGHLHLLRHVREGAWWVVAILVMTWAYDTGAYFAGRLFGRRPFMHHVSPKKTLEGVMGGLVLSGVAGMLPVFAIGLTLWQGVALGVLTGAVAQFGDLLESMLKRQTGVKDSGVLIPGHGGLLDRIDSLLLTGTLGYYAALMLGFGG